MVRRWAWLAALWLAGCASVGPRFSPEIATSFARDDMRRLETRSLVVYYPAHAKETVLHTLARLEQCAENLRSVAKSDTPRPKLVILITSAEFNNAFVRASALGTPTEMVIPLQMGSEVFNFFDFGVTNIGDISCHEAVHYVQLEQTDGFWRNVNLIFGDVASPNLGTETWFLEGLATYLEGHLGHGDGRPHSPLWEGMYASGIASQGGELQAGQLSPAQRQLYPFGGNYLAGSHFIGWLAKTYGEDKLWQLIDKQGRSLFYPFGVTLRVHSVYGKTLGELLEAYNADLRRELGDRPRPPDQMVLSADQGYFARLASGPSGELVSLTVGLDQESRLELREPDGTLRFSVPLTKILPIRPYILSSPSNASGLSMTRDGRWIYLFSEDMDVDTGSTYAVRKFDAQTGDYVQSWRHLRGVGGSVLPDGTGYVFVSIRDGVPELAQLDFATGETRLLTHFGTHDPLGAPSVSPDGRRIAFSRFEGHGFNLFVREPDGSVRALTRDGRFNYSPRWINPDQLVLLREAEDGRAQAHLIDASTGAVSQITHAPWAVMDPVPAADGRIAFLNREGWHWTLDTAPLQAPSAAAPEATAPEAAPPTPAPVTIENDSRYSALDELFIPRLRVPFVGATFDPRNRLQLYAAASLLGSDRLGLHTWAVNATYDGYAGEPSVSVGYGNSQLAPWFLTLELARTVARRALYPEGAELRPDNVIGSGRTNDLSATVTASRPFWTTDVSLSARVLDRTDQLSIETTATTETRQPRHTRLIGPSASLSWFAGANTPYAGTRRGLAADFSAAFYPHSLGSSFNLGDLRAALTTWIPLPGLQRQSFSIGVRGRVVPSPVDGVLQIGGVSSGYYLRNSGLGSAPSPDIFLPGLSFVEPLRGFDDVSFRANAVGILSLRYRYPFIVDRGTTSTLWLFPSFFLRQLDLEGFFDGARTDERTSPFHGAVGAAIRLRTLWGSALPASLFYQYAYRLDPHLGSQHVIGLTFD